MRPSLESLSRLSELASRAHRQRGARPAATRHLRRADGRRLSVQQVRRRHFATTGGRTCSASLDWLPKNWQRPDEGIWEVRGGRREFLHSRLMCWVAFDRAIRLAEKRSLAGADGRVASRSATRSPTTSSRISGTKSCKAFVQTRARTRWTRRCC